MAKTKHDTAVEKTAKKLKKEGFNVKADVPGFRQPPNMGGCRPDIYAEKGKDKRIIEIETSKSKTTDKSQQMCLKKQAKKLGAKYEQINLK
jgi:hypothetical protein